MERSLGDAVSEGVAWAAGAVALVFLLDTLLRRWVRAPPHTHRTSPLQRSSRTHARTHATESETGCRYPLFALLDTD
jgi:uncharacterized protein (DUF924 family)